MYEAISNNQPYRPISALKFNFEEQGDYFQAATKSIGRKRNPHGLEFLLTSNQNSLPNGKAVYFDPDQNLAVIFSEASPDEIEAFVEETVEQAINHALKADLTPA